MPQISVILPVYNARAFLKECLISLSNQTFTDFEVVCVDDGSTDDSCALLQSYASTDNRFRIIHTKHQGVSSARNRALSTAQGDYISFVDADDKLASDYLKVLFLSAQKTKADVVWCDYVSDECQLKNISDSLEIKTYLDGWRCFVNRSPNMGCCLWNKLYKSDLLKNLWFLPSLAIGEDIVFLHQVIYRSRYVAYVSLPLYFYRIHSSSVTHSLFNEGILDGNIQTARALQTLFKNQPMDKKTRDRFNRQIAKRFFKFCVLIPRRIDRKYHTSFYKTYRTILAELKYEDIYQPQHLDLKNRFKSWVVTRTHIVKQNLIHGENK